MLTLIKEGIGHQPPLPQDHADGGRRIGQVGRLEERGLDLGVGAAARAPMWSPSCPTWREAMPRSGQNEKALEYLTRAKALQPKATSVNSLEVILLEPHRQGAAGLQTDQGTGREPGPTTST
jgi:hypothetical protein